MRLIALRAIIVLTIGIVALSLWQMREATQLLAISIVVSAGLTPLVDKLIERGLSRPRAAAIVFIGCILLLVGGLAALITRGIVELARMLDDLPLWYSTMRDTLLKSTGWASQLGQALPDRSFIDRAVNQESAATGGTILGIASQAINGIALTIGVAALGFYWLLDQPRIERLWLSLLPLTARTRVRAVWVEIYREVGIYVRGVVVQVIITSLALNIVFELLGIPGAVILATLGGLSQVVPLLGPPLAILPAALIALSQGWLTAGLTLIGALAVLLIIRLLVAPRFYANGINVNPVLIIVLIMALFEVGGLAMILLAPPLAAAIQASARVLNNSQRSQTSSNGKATALQERLDQISASIDADSPEAARLQGLVERARRLVGEAEQLT